MTQLHLDIPIASLRTRAQACENAYHYWRSKRDEYAERTWSPIAQGLYESANDACERAYEAWCDARGALVRASFK